MHKFDRARQQFVDSVAHDGVRLAAADLHQHPGPGCTLSDLSGEGPGDALVAVLIEIFHIGAVSCLAGSGRTDKRTRLPQTLTADEPAICDERHVALPGLPSCPKNAAHDSGQPVGANPASSI